jgi:hypothetical protein
MLNWECSSMATNEFDGRMTKLGSIEVIHTVKAQLSGVVIKSLSERAINIHVLMYAL